MSTVGYNFNVAEWRAWHGIEKISSKSAHLGRALALPIAIVKVVQPIFENVARLGEEVFRFGKSLKAQHALSALGRLIAIPFSPLIGLALAVKTLFLMLLKPLEYSKRRVAKKQLQMFYYKQSSLNEQQRDLAQRAYRRYCAELLKCRNSGEVAALQFPSEGDLLKEVIGKDAKLTSGKSNFSAFLQQQKLDADAKSIEHKIADAAWKRYKKEVQGCSAIVQLDAMRFLDSDAANQKFVLFLREKKGEWERDFKSYRDKHAELLGVDEPFKSLRSQYSSSTTLKLYASVKKKKPGGKGKKYKKSGGAIAEVSKEKYQRAEQLYTAFKEHKKKLIAALCAVDPFDSTAAIDKEGGSK